MCAFGLDRKEQSTAGATAKPKRQDYYKEPANEPPRNHRLIIFSVSAAFCYVSCPFILRFSFDRCVFHPNQSYDPGRRSGNNLDLIHRPTGVRSAALR